MSSATNGTANSMATTGSGAPMGYGATADPTVATQSSTPNLAALTQGLNAGAKIALPAAAQSQMRSSQSRPIQLPAQQFSGSIPTVITPGSADGNSLLALMQKYRA